LVHFEGALEKPWPGEFWIKTTESWNSRDIWCAELMGVT